MCPRPHLGTLSDIHCPPIPDLWVFGEGGAEPGCNTSDIRGSQVWGSKWARGREAHSQQPLDQASARHGCWPERDTETGLCEGAVRTGQPGRPRGGEGVAGLGETTPTGFGIHSKFSALVANARLLTEGVSEEESLQGAPRALWVLCIHPCSPPVSPQTQPTWRVPETPPSAGQLCQ